MSTLEKNFVLLFIIVCAAYLLAGCTSDSASETTNVVIVGGIRANQPSINVTGIEEKVQAAVESAGTVSIISVEGEPRLVGTVYIPELKKNIDPTKKKKIIEQYTNEIMQLVSQSKAVTEEADCLGALQMAARQLAAADGRKVLIVVDNGISTAGALDFTKLSLANLDVEKKLAELSSEEEIPLLKDIAVYWAGLGQCAGRQETLRNKEYNRLTELWTGILEMAGAKVNILTDISAGDQVSDELPSVTPVAVSRPIEELEEIEDAQETVKEALTVYHAEYRIGEEVASFLPDSAELKNDEKELKSILEPVARYLQDNSANQVVLIGTTASAGNISGDDSSAVMLSGQRCETIKSILLSFGGIDAEQIKTIGLGYQKAEKHGFAVKDVDTAGNFVEMLGEQNRQVIIMDAGSERGIAALALR